ncbi:MAG: phytanoyl-CoA dioxygenase family protein [Pseudomonadota bacterium]|nr:MAG: phytanoyl-CoA dioxygenase [Pseudomonadota bacterium]
MRATAILKAPLWVAALASGAKSFVDNPVIGSRRLNEWGLHEYRVRLAAAMAAYRRRRLARILSLTEEDRRAFERDGYIVKENFLPQEFFEQIRAEVLDATWDVREMRQGNCITRRVPLDFDALASRCPGLARVGADRTLKDALRYIASTKGEPTYWIQAVLAGLPDGKPDPQSVLHADTFHSTAKAWLFLHDVGPDDGPFAYVPGSHRMTPERLAWEREQSITARHHPIPYHARGSFRATLEDLRRMNLPEPKKMVVRGNTLVVADTMGFHARTLSTRPTVRVELYASLRRNPYLPWLGLDPLSLPMFRNRTACVSIRVLQQLRRFGLAKMPWKPVGHFAVNTPYKAGN